MLTWLREFLYDERVFLSAMRVFIILLGEGFRNGLIPTGVDHGGAAIGSYVSILAAFINRPNTSTKNGNPPNNGN